MQYENLIGRKVVSVKLDEEGLPWRSGEITLDNGVTLDVLPNKGCACAYGNYDITLLDTTENMIMSVREEVEETEYGDTGNVSLWVMMDGIPGEKKIIQADGEDNGYYGYGFYLRVSEKE